MEGPTYTAKGWEGNLLSWGGGIETQEVSLSLFGVGSIPASYSLTSALFGGHARVSQLPGHSIRTWTIALRQAFQRLWQGATKTALGLLHMQRLTSAVPHNFCWGHVTSNVPMLDTNLSGLKEACGHRQSQNINLLEFTGSVPGSPTLQTPHTQRTCW